MVNKLFKNTNVKVAYRTKNNLGKLLKPHKTLKPDKYEKSGVYQLERLTYHKTYIGQTGRPFRVRYREHYNDFKYANMLFAHSPNMLLAKGTPLAQWTI